MTKNLSPAGKEKAAQLEGERGKSEATKPQSINSIESAASQRRATVDAISFVGALLVAQAGIAALVFVIFKLGGAL